MDRTITWVGLEIGSMLLHALEGIMIQSAQLSIKIIDCMSRIVVTKTHPSVTINLVRPRGGEER